MSIVVLAAVAGFLVFAFALGILPVRDLSSRSAEPYGSSAELAQALNRGGVECDFKQQKIGKRVDPGFCHDPEETAGIGLSLDRFVSEEVTERWVRDHRRCGYFDAVAGPNWMITVDGDAEAEAVLEAVGGRLIAGDSC